MVKAKTKETSLQDLIDTVPDLVEYLYNDTPGPHSRTTTGLSPVPPEYSNWRDEQRAWRETAVLFDQSHHMPELIVEGPDALRLLKSIGVNSFEAFSPGRAMQFVGCNFHGEIIGDCIMHRHDEGRFQLISGMPLLNWVRFQAEVEKYDVLITRDDATSDNKGQRVNFRFGMDGPSAEAIFLEAVEGVPPDLKFFRTARVRISGHEVLALRHGMAGHFGVELSGPSQQGLAVREALLEAGAKYGLRPGGTRAYFSAAFESGWIGYPLPAIYTGDDLRNYRQWLPSDSWEAKFQLGGSFRPQKIEEYYLNPLDLGYGRLIKLDHDFIGRESLEKLAADPRHSKVTLVWNKDDVSRIFASMLQAEDPYKYLELPVSDYAFPHRDEVRSKEGQLVGTSTQCGYSFNERTFLSLAIVDAEYAAPGTQIEVIWGEPNGGSRKPRVERHRQTQIRATVAPVPYAQAARKMKQVAGVISTARHGASA